MLLRLLMCPTEVNRRTHLHFLAYSQGVKTTTVTSKTMTITSITATVTSKTTTITAPKKPSSSSTLTKQTKSERQYVVSAPPMNMLDFEESEAVYDLGGGHPVKAGGDAGNILLNTLDMGVKRTASGCTVMLTPVSRCVGGYLHVN